MTKHIQIEAYEIHTETKQYGIALFKKSDEESFGFRLTRFIEAPFKHEQPGGMIIPIVNDRFGFETLEAARIDAEEFIERPMKHLGV